jgi:AbiV family abortive infection protein
MSVTPQFILKGAAYALEQCGLLLRDANTLYRNRAYANTIVLTAFAREELGRYRLLLDFWREASAGQTFTIDELKSGDHVEKQRAGMLSTVIRADRDSGVGKVLNARMKSLPQSEQWKEANAALKQIDESKKKRTPTDRHEERQKALYVGPVSETEWNRPATISAMKAYEDLEHAVNDYSVCYCQGYIEPGDMLRHIDPDLHKALEQWSDRPTLVPPEWPQWPVSL